MDIGGHQRGEFLVGVALQQVRFKGLVDFGLTEWTLDTGLRGGLTVSVRVRSFHKGGGFFIRFP